MSYQDLVRPHAGFHPAQITDYIPDKICIEKTAFTETRYDALTDKSGYAEYAWAFLRRNKFYQTLVDKGSDILFPLPMWGYRQSDSTQSGAEWDYHCGLWTAKPNKLKPYHEVYDKGTPPLWYPLEYLRHFMCGEIGRSSALEDPTTQLQITLDLGGKFAPNVIGLQKQLRLAHDGIKTYFEQLVLAAQESPNKKKERAIKFPIGLQLRSLEITAPKKSNLRRYLYVVDLLTGQKGETLHRIREDLSHKVLGEYKIKRALEIHEVAKKLNPELKAAASSDKDITKAVDSVGKEANKAFEYVYQWQCLGLLTLQD